MSKVCPGLVGHLTSVGLEEMKEGRKVEMRKEKRKCGVRSYVDGKNVNEMKVKRET